jgi:hypothetical protein
MHRLSGSTMEFLDFANNFLAYILLGEFRDIIVFK